MSREVLGPPDDGAVPAWGDDDAPTPTPPDLASTGATPHDGQVRVTDLDLAGTPAATATLLVPREPAGTGTAGTPPTGTDATVATPATGLATAARSAPGAGPELADPDGAATGAALPRLGSGSGSGVAWPAAAPLWVRGPWGLVTAVAAGLLVGALAAGAVAERSRLAAESEQVRVLADLVSPVRDDTRTGVLRTSLDVVNAGPAALTVVGADLTPGNDVIDVVARRRIEPGDHVVVPVSVVPACEGPVAENLELEVSTGDGDTTRVTARSLGGRGLPLRRLRDLCAAAGEPIEIWRVLARRDGTLTVQLLNTSAEDHEVGIALPSGTSETSVPSLPTTVPAGSSAFLQIRLRVDECTSEAQAAAAGSGVRLTLDEQRGPVFDTDATAVAGWFARQVALACPPG